MGVKKRLHIPVGTVRIMVKDLKPYEKTRTSWKRSTKRFPEVPRIVKLFKAHKNIKILIDTKDSRFLKGQLGSNGLPQGARINILPNGDVIDKAFSLFATNLTVHDQSSDDHWDVLYQNKGGTYAYCYTLDKINRHRNEKFHKVWKFDKVQSKLLKNVEKALKDKDDTCALPMYTLLNTHMRIGNEIYYRAHGHKGLTTLKKKDIKIKGNNVVFDYIAKDGVPRRIEQKFSPTYVRRLKNHLTKCKRNDFVFKSAETGRPIPEHHFKKAFKKYCGTEFYPHIIRSHYATKQVKDFLKGKRTISKKDADTLFLSIAEKLGHKRFVKKDCVWKDNYTVTVNHYVQPELVQKVKLLMK
ncbi:hypothetical protein HOL21_00045 [Candidatus Woesearchaeota archaeon]|jgi:hypothetical protein|nr:hypothetical protein [Candidatus Woesearchaeota archaeon]MBT5396590.1 hypothetical protein [Candidatus Woesearchaeota archaeon]MBT6367984.1 hypothetical protein [Candidatus Woesearchaeota archaeon]MBT7762244.1 hypothetical protein [Candidatus Woesearchaeota archaeon]